MKKHFFLMAIIGCSLLGLSNNINVSNVYLSGQNTTSDFTMINFGISWDNSWRTSTYESNWDAAWVFVKYRLKTSNIWKHATLHTTGHTVPAGASFTTTTDGKGTFINKSANGIGTNNFTGAQLRWNYGVDLVQDGDSVEVCVFAIEMVYIPQGNYYLGDGPSAFCNPTTGTPFLVSSENFITLGGAIAGNLKNGSLMNVMDDFDNSTTQTLPSAFPKGYNPFYSMKYEITQEQYVEFLNKLTYTQQIARTAVAPNSVAGTGALSNSYRNGIDILAPGVSTSTPAVYACNLNGNTTYNETDDGQNIACNHLSWADVAAYLDWSCLQPMTEFQYEKSCRGGTLSPVNGEYAWGTSSSTVTTGITNSAMSNEVASNAGSNVVSIPQGSGPQGPMRVGNFAQAATNRVTSGGSYYGIMELTGNVSERFITVGNPTGRAYTGLIGDGALNATGDANVTNWPSTSAVGVGFKGFGTVSTRFYNNTTVSTRNYTDGGRGVRTAP